MPMTNLPPDPVIEEVHAVRAQMLAEAGGDLKTLLAGIARRQRLSDRPVRQPPPSDAPLRHDPAGAALPNVPAHG